MKIFYALSHREFALIWSGQLISRLGDSLYQIALVWWVLEKTGSATEMGTVLILTTIPLFLFLLIGGAIVDRFSRLRMMLYTDIWRGSIVSVLAFLAWNNRLEMWHIYLASLFFGLTTAFFRPAYRAIIPELLPQDMLPSANSLTELGWQFSGIIGPALGAFIIMQSGSSILFFLDGLTFFIASICLIPLLRFQVSPIPTPNHKNILLDIREGFSTVFRIPWLWLTIAMFSFVNLTGRAPIQVSLAFLIKENMQADVDTLGLLYSIFAVGSVIGAIWMGRRKTAHRSGFVMYGMFTIVGFMTMMMGISIQLFGTAIAFLILGLTLAIANLTWANTLQQHIPTGLYGRVTSINSLGIEFVLPFGFVLAGWTTDRFSASFTFVVGGILTATIAGLGIFHPAIRSLD